MVRVCEIRLMTVFLINFLHNASKNVSEDKLVEKHK